MAKTLADGTPACRIVALEVTRSCNLACRHCRAEAHPEPFEGELTTGEIKNLLDSFAEAGSSNGYFYRRRTTAQARYL